MSFDKVKAMRNAERFLAQGKIRAAINEYKRVIEYDSKDYSTLNILGDLYAKASEEDEAVKCFTQVAEYYSRQGFAQKAIAIYNKIARLTPDSLEVSAKLAQLYQMKGSVAEARSHYNILADQYTRTGRKAEALMVWTQIAKLDPSNTDICLKIADAYQQDELKEEAATAYVEAGKRLSAKNQFDSSVTVYSKALELKPDNLIAIRGFIDAQINLGYTDEAAKKLEELLESQPYNREIIYLLVDCYIDMDKFAEAEHALIKLVEQEPSSYPKCIDLVRVYLKNSDLNSAVRVLSIASEHLLVGGQAEELEKWINEILAKNPEQVDALRMLVHFHSWQRDETEMKHSLERLAEAAKLANSIEDERNALSQLIMISPQNADFAQRLQEINLMYGNSDSYYESEYKIEKEDNDVPTFESYAILNDEYENDSNGQNLTGYEEFSGELHITDNGNYSGESVVESSFNEFTNSNNGSNSENNTYLDSNLQSNKTVEQSEYRQLSELEEYNLQKEVESVEFYIEQGYKDLAEKTLEDLEKRFGKCEAIEKLRENLKNQNDGLSDGSSVDLNAQILDPVVEKVSAFDSSLETVKESPAKEIEPQPVQFNPLEEFQSELGLEENEPVEHGDYDTHFHTGVAYKEMGLMEEAIRELQDAVKSVSVNDGTRRFFLCCNLIGHCFMENQMPNLAVMWFNRALQANGLKVDEIQGSRYELANAFEMDGDFEKAIEQFEEIYANDVNYRDVGKRLKKLQKK